MPLNYTTSVLVNRLMWNTKFYQKYLFVTVSFSVHLLQMQYAVKINQSFFFGISTIHTTGYIKRLRLKTLKNNLSQNDTGTSRSIQINILNQFLFVHAEK